MNSIERKLTYTVRQYERQGFYRSYFFVDAYENTRLMQSIMIDQLLNNNELNRFLNVFISRLNKGESTQFFDSTEKRMNKFFVENTCRLTSLEHSIASKMGKDEFEKHYEKQCYYLLFTPKGTDKEVEESFPVSETYSPLMCLKMAHQLGTAQGENYRIVLSDHLTEVNPELLSFAIGEK